MDGKNKRSEQAVRVVSVVPTILFQLMTPVLILFVIVLLFIIF